MRRLVLVLAVVVTGLVGSALPASAAGSTHDVLDNLATGPFTGTQSFDFGTGGCSFVHQVFDGTYETVYRRSGTFHVDSCVNVPTTGNAFTYTGTFQLTAPFAGTLTGTVTGTTDAGLPRAELQLTLTVVSGTRAFRFTTGTIRASGTWENETFGHGPTSGTFSADLNHR